MKPIRAFFDFAMSETDEATRIQNLMDARRNAITKANFDLAMMLSYKNRCNSFDSHEEEKVEVDRNQRVEEELKDISEVEISSS